MRSRVSSLAGRRTHPRATVLPTCLTGQVVAVDTEGRAIVDFPDNPGVPLVARSVLPDRPAFVKGSQVLLLFENGDPLLPIVFAMAEPAVPAPSARVAQLDTTQELFLRAKSLTLDAGREIILRCGKSSVTLRADGTVVVKGANLLSRSSGPNRIKGASVKLN